MMLRTLFLSVLCFSSWAFSAPVALVYDGAGACPENCAASAADVARLAGFSVTFVNASHWDAADFARAAIYIQPGGHSAEVAQALTHEQKEQLRSFVRGGGGYVGFCAGAFFASARTELGDGSFKDDERLGLIPMTSKLLSVPTEAAVLPVLWNGVTRQVYWEGGPYLKAPLAPGVEAMAFYADGSIASARTLYGSGRVYVTGFHPEAPQDWRDAFKLVDSDGLDQAEGAAMLLWATGR